MTADPDLTLLLQQQNTMIIEMRALTATVRRLDEEVAARLGRVETRLDSLDGGSIGDELRAINRKLDDIAARLGNLEVAR